MTSIDLGVFRAAGHRLVDKIVDEFEELILEGLPDVAPPSGGEWAVCKGCQRRFLVPAGKRGRRPLYCDRPGCGKRARWRAAKRASRARAAAPEAPPVPAKIVDAPSRNAAIAHHPAPPAALRNGEALVSSPQRIDGGELIPEASRDFHCNTCAAKIATITCDTCNGLFCPGCWGSHLLTHRRPGRVDWPCDPMVVRHA